MEVPQKRLCQHCGKSIQGRLDKKFCDDQCRNAYHNQQNADNVNQVRKINGILKKNRRVLAALIPIGEKMVKMPKNRLTQAGFNFNYFTHIYRNKKGSQYCYCYDLGYLELEEGMYLLVHGKEFD